MSIDAPPTERTLPHNLEAERSVLGAVLVDNQAFNSAAEVLGRDDFHREAHRRIFDAMAALAERSQPIDLVTLKDELARLEALNDEYDQRFGFPFIIAVRGLGRQDIIEAMARRLPRSGEEEFAEALQQVERIARLRLDALLAH